MPSGFRGRICPIEGGAILRRGALLGVAPSSNRAHPSPNFKAAAVVIAVAGYALRRHPVEHPPAGGRILAQPDQAIYSPAPAHVV